MRYYLVGSNPVRYGAVNGIGLFPNELGFGDFVAVLSDETGEG
jgi:hypothetical protein